MKITCLIVDDEHTAREGLRLLLRDFPQIDLVGTCKNGIEAIDEIQALRPDLVLLDIQMPMVNGFEVLASIPKPHPQIIFITAHDEYAVRAFEIHALDYLLKPFSDERFASAISRATENIRLAKAQNYAHLLKSTNQSSGESIAEKAKGRLAVRADGAIHLLPFSEISHVEAYDYYVKIFTKNRFYITRDTMKSMESQLPSSDFIRIHKSYIVNQNQLKSLEKTDQSEYEVVLNSGVRLRVSRSKVTELKTLFGS